MSTRIVDYKSMQLRVKNVLSQNLQATPVNIRLLNNNVIATIGIFVSGLAKNIDTLQNPTSITGETNRFVVVPGIDFVISGQTNTPQVSGTVEWVSNTISYKKIISSVAMEMPIPNTPIIFTLGIE